MEQTRHVETFVCHVFGDALIRHANFVLLKNIRSIDITNVTSVRFASRTASSPQLVPVSRAAVFIAWL